MRCIHLMLLVAVVSMGCNNKTSKSVDTLKARDSTNVEPEPDLIIKAFKEDENLALDSIAKYGLDSASNFCKELLYVIFGKDTLRDEQVARQVTLGECSIRLIHFTKVSTRHCLLNYIVFIDDSIPADPVLLTLNGRIPLGFEVDKVSRKIVSVKSNDSNGVDISRFTKLYKDIIQSKQFKQNIVNDRAKLDSGFLRVIERLSKRLLSNSFVY